MSHNFRKPSEMKEKKEPKLPISTRIKQSAFELLEKAAASQGEKVGWLAAKGKHIHARLDIINLRRRCRRAET